MKRAAFIVGMTVGVAALWGRVLAQARYDYCRHGTRFAINPMTQGNAEFCYNAPTKEIICLFPGESLDCLASIR